MVKSPFVSICTPTFNRRPFIPIIIQCFLNQDYPKNRMEWIIIDDGTDKIEDLVKNIPQVRYFKYDEKLTLGKKRNLAHEFCKGEIIVYMDDDDYYPPCRVSHAVCKLKENSNILCAGSSEMYVYFKHINKMYQFGPYGPNHSTAATFAFKRELLKQTSFDDNASLAEEKHFLKNYTIPFIQLDPLKTILVFSHIHNSFDKKDLLNQPPNKFMNVSTKEIDDFVKEPEIKLFFLDKIDDLLSSYVPGRPEFKPDVLKQMEVIKKEHLYKIAKIEEENKRREEEEIRNQQFQLQNYCKILSEQTVIIQELTMENNLFKNKIKYLEDKIRKMIEERIDIAKKN